MLLMIQCQKSIRFAPQNLHAIFAERNWKKSFSGCINYFESNPKIRRDSAINGKYGSTKHETWIEQYLLNCIVQFRSQYLYDIASDFFFVISENELSVIYENISNFSSNTEEPKPLWCRIWIFLWFLKMNYMWFMGIFPICYFYCLQSNFMKFLTPISNGFCLHLSRMTQQNWCSTHVQHGSGIS